MGKNWESVNGQRSEPQRRASSQPPLAPFATWLRSRGLPCGMSLAMLAAPLLGLLYDVNLAIGVAAAALFASAFLALQAIPFAELDMRPRLRIVAIINTSLALICAAVLMARLFL